MRYLPINDIYSVSDTGSVINTLTERNLKLTTHHSGYITVTLRTGYTKPSTFRVHRLVAQAFIINPESKLEVNHKDRDKANNKLENLEWCTAKENTAHVRALGFKGYSFKNGEVNPQSKLSEIEAKEILRLAALNLDLTSLSTMFKVHLDTIENIVKGRSWKHLDR